MKQIKQNINKFRSYLARRQEILNNEKKRRTLFAAGLMQFNCRNTFNQNRDNVYGTVRTTVDKTAFFK